MPLKAVYDSNQKYIDFKDETNNTVANASLDLEHYAADVTIYTDKLEPEVTPTDIQYEIEDELRQRFNYSFDMRVKESRGTARYAATARQVTNGGVDTVIAQARVATQPLMDRLPNNPPWLRRAAVIVGAFIVLLLLFLIIRGVLSGDTNDTTATANGPAQATALARTGTGAATSAGGQATRPVAANVGNLGATPVPSPNIIVPTLPPSPAAATGPQHTITVIDPDPNGLNFRENAGPENKLLGTVKFGAKLTDLGRRTNLQLNWRQVRTSDGREGWVAEGDTSGPLVSDLSVGAQAKVQTGQTPNLRTEPSVQSKTVRQLAAGEKLTVTGLDKGTGVPGVWWKVKTEKGEEGWVAENDGTSALIVPG